MHRLIIETNQLFSFHATLFSHGWSDLLPFQIDNTKQILTYRFGNSRLKNIKIEITYKDKNLIITTEDNTFPREDVKRVIQRIFRLNEDLSEFYALTGKHKQWNWIIEKGAGRMLRCATIWEDMVKMLCTTNCTWRLTQIMTENLFHILGKSETFPSAEIIAAKDEQFLRNEIKMGYRAPYLLQFAQQVALGQVDINAFENWHEDSNSLYKKIREIKGFGDYAVSSLMKLLGRYDFMGFDSWNRKQYYNLHNHNKPCSDERITKYYQKFGKWAGLFFWLDVTKDWYFRDNPWE